MGGPLRGLGRVGGSRPKGRARYAFDNRISGPDGRPPIRFSTLVLDPAGSDRPKRLPMGADEGHAALVADLPDGVLVRVTVAGNPGTEGVTGGGWSGPLGPAPCGAGGSVLLAGASPTPRSPNDTDNGVWDQDRPKNNNKTQGTRQQTGRERFQKTKREIQRGETGEEWQGKKRWRRGRQEAARAGAR